MRTTARVRRLVTAQKTFHVGPDKASGYFSRIPLTGSSEAARMSTNLVGVKHPPLIQVKRGVFRPKSLNAISRSEEEGQ